MRLLERLAEVQRGDYTPNKDYPWWYDNMGHLFAGFVIGSTMHIFVGTGLMITGAAFVGIAGVWELYERLYRIRPWDEREDWSRDRAIEDTLLDTYVGLTGAILSVIIL